LFHSIPLLFGILVAILMILCFVLAIAAIKALQEKRVQINNKITTMDIDADLKMYMVSFKK